MSSAQTNIRKFRVIIQKLTLEKLKNSSTKSIRRRTRNIITRFSSKEDVRCNVLLNGSHLSLYLLFLTGCYNCDSNHQAETSKDLLQNALRQRTQVREIITFNKNLFSRRYGLGWVPRHLPMSPLPSTCCSAPGAIHVSVEKNSGILHPFSLRSIAPIRNLSTSTATRDGHLQDQQQQPLKKKRNYSSSMPFDDRWDDIQKSLAVLGRMSTGNIVTPFRDNDVAFSKMWMAVDGATQEVLWQTYICKDDEVGRKTLQKMVSACLRQCKVELLYDSGGNISGRTRLTEQLKNCGGNIITYRPFFPSVLRYFFEGLDWRRSPGLRNHRKILLVDGKIGFCGGLNIGNEYCSQRLGGNNKFRDTHCAIHGPAVAHLREIYDDTKAPQTWKYGWARWRQIASNKLNHRFEVSKQAVETNILLPIQYRTRKVTEKGGIYFRQQVYKAEKSTQRILRHIRWERQWERISKWMGWYNKKVSPLLNRGPETVVPGQAKDPKRSSETCEIQDRTESMANENAKQKQLCCTKKESLLSDVGGEDSLCVGLCSEKSSFRNDSDEIAPLITLKLVDDESPAKNVKSAQSVAMRRRTARKRIQALHQATNITHKRNWTCMLLDVPIADTDPVPEAEGYGSCRPVTTQILSCNPRYHDYSIQYAFWQVIRKCHRRIWITTPYYLPNKKLFHALLHAAGRGVDVRILSGGNKTTDPWFMWHASNYVTERLISNGVRIYEYRGTQVMHAKTVVVDSVWSSIGSYNWDLMSNKNLEVCLCQLDVRMARDMERHFLDDLMLSEEVKLEDHRKRSVWLCFTSYLFYNIIHILQKIAFFSFANEDLEASRYIPRRQGR